MPKSIRTHLQRHTASGIHQEQPSLQPSSSEPKWQNSDPTLAQLFDLRQVRFSTPSSCPRAAFPSGGAVPVERRRQLARSARLLHPVAIERVSKTEDVTTIKQSTWVPRGRTPAAQLRRAYARSSRAVSVAANKTAKWDRPAAAKPHLNATIVYIPTKLPQTKRGGERSRRTDQTPDTTNS